MQIARRDLRFAFHGDAGCANRQVETHDRAGQTVSDEQFSFIAAIEKRGIPWAIDKRRVGYTLDLLAAAVDYQDRAVASVAASSIRRRKIPYQNKSPAQNIQSGGEAQQSTALKEDPYRTTGTRRHVHNGGAGALEIQIVVEVRDQDVAGVYGARRELPRNESDAVRIDVTIGGYGGNRVNLSRKEWLRQIAVLCSRYERRRNYQEKRRDNDDDEAFA